MVLEKGQKIWFSDGKKSFRVREANDKFAICTQPYNFKPNTVIYTIIDFEHNIRGLDNMVFGMHDYYSDEDCADAMKDLMSGKMEVSRKHHKHVVLDIVDKHKELKKLK